MESTYCLWSYGHSTRFGCLISTICKEEEKTLKILDPQSVEAKKFCRFVSKSIYIFTAQCLIKHSDNTSVFMLNITLRI